MKVSNPQELVGKEVCDSSGNTVGWIDKTWKSWNDNYPGYFYGIKPNENARDTYFRGTRKLIPITSDYIKEVGQGVTLNRTMNELFRLWNKTVLCGPSTCPTDMLLDMPVFDKHHSKVGTLYAWVESDASSKYYGCFVDPYLSETWKIPHNTLMPIPTSYIKEVKDAITLDKTLDELRTYWKQNYPF